MTESATGKPATRSAGPQPVPGVLELAPYQMGSSKIDDRPAPMKLSSNESALGTPPAAIEAFHAVEVPPSEQWVETEPGVMVGRVWRGLDRVAAYVPGGTAPLPSSLLMSVIPAQVAGVPEIVISGYRQSAKRIAGRQVRA